MAVRVEHREDEPRDRARAGALRGRGDAARRPRPKRRVTTTGKQRVAGIALSGTSTRTSGSRAVATSCCACSTSGVLRWYIAEVELERSPAAARGFATPCGSSRAACSRACCRSWRSAFKLSADGSSSVYRRLDRLLVAGREPEVDPIEPDIRDLGDEPRPAARARPKSCVARGVASDAVDALIAYLLHASDQDVARIRPLELAAEVRGRRRSDGRGVLARGQARRASSMVWDVICPSCRIPSNDRRVAREDRAARALPRMQRRVRRRLLARHRAGVSCRRRSSARSRPARTASAARRTSRTSRRKFGSRRASALRCRSRFRPASICCGARSCRAHHELRVASTGGDAAPRCHARRTASSCPAHDRRRSVDRAGQSDRRASCSCAWSAQAIARSR